MHLHDRHKKERKSALTTFCSFYFVNIIRFLNIQTFKRSTNIQPDNFTGTMAADAQTPANCLYTVAMVMCHLSYCTCLTPGSVEPRKAATGIGTQTIQAAGPVHTGIGITVVYVHLAQVTPVTQRTPTPEKRRKIHFK